MLADADYSEIRNELLSSARPLFLFHDDPDGLTSFLLLYRLVKRGSGTMVKAVPRVDSRFIQRASDPSFDKVFIMDIAMVEQSFVDAVAKPVIWIDHHQPLQISNVRYYNPRVGNISDNYPASYLCYKVAGQPEDLWIAMAGIVGDWAIPEFADEFAAAYPDLWSSSVKSPDDALFETRLGILIKVLAFCLKGPVEDALKCVKMLTRITSPYEILNQTSSAGKYLMDKFNRINEDYASILDRAKEHVSSDRFIIYTYKGNQSFSGEAANEVLHFNKDKIIVIGREREGEVRMSIRGSGGNIILPRLKKALEGINGYGGGHEYACGAAVKIEDFPRFIENFKKQFD